MVVVVRAAGSVWTRQLLMERKDEGRGGEVVEDKVVDEREEAHSFC